MRKNSKVFIMMLIIVIVIFNYSFVIASSPELPNVFISGEDGNIPPAKPDGDEPIPPVKPDGNPGGEGVEPPAKPDGEGGAPGGNNSTNVNHIGVTTISSDTTNKDVTYSSTEGSQNALLVIGGLSTLSDVSVTKSGDSDGDESDFYGTNAAILAKKGTLNINGGVIETEGAHANGVFAYSDGIINISNTTIKTRNNNSGAIMVTGGGTLNANNITATTDGNSSAPIRSDRGGGTIIVNGGTYISNGVGSPVIYSTADITVNDATLISSKSEGVVVEGKNSIKLNNTTLTDTNTSLNGNSETYKNIFLYQSMSGDASVGNASFISENSTITTNNGDTIFVTNTSATISLTNNKIVNNDSNGGFLRIGSGKWGKTGSNGGDVILNLSNQIIDGNIYVDNISTLAMNLLSGSRYLGIINSDNTAKTLVVTLDRTSTLTLTGNSYITELNNEVLDNSNINLNGYTLYVNGTAITHTDYKGAITLTDNVNDNNTDTLEENGDNKNLKDIFKEYINTIILVLIIIILVAVLGYIISISRKKK